MGACLISQALTCSGTLLSLSSIPTLETLLRKSVRHNTVIQTHCLGNNWADSSTHEAGTKRNYESLETKKTDTISVQKSVSWETWREQWSALTKTEAEKTHGRSGTADQRKGKTLAKSMWENGAREVGKEKTELEYTGRQEGGVEEWGRE